VQVNIPFSQCTDFNQSWEFVPKAADDSTNFMKAQCCATLKLVFLEADWP